MIARQCEYLQTGNERGGNDDFRIDQLLVKGGVLAVLVGGGDQSVALPLDPLSQTKLILGGTKKARLLFGVLAALFSLSISFWPCHVIPL